MSLDFNSKPLGVEYSDRCDVFPLDMGYGKPSIDENPLPVFHVVLEEGDDNKIIGECVEIDGVVSIGSDTEKVMTKMRTTIKEVLEIKQEPCKNFNLSPILKGLGDPSHS